MPWLITKIKDCGRGRLYRWYVEGLNTEAVTAVTFAWAVQSVADDRYQPSPDADDETLRGVLVAKIICSPPPALQSWKDRTPGEILAAMREAEAPSCLACAREECAAAGYPGIDREQRGHVCRAYTVDDEPIDLDDFLAVNAEDLSPEQVAEIKHLMSGDSLLLGGGAGATFTLKRTR